MEIWLSGSHYLTKEYIFPQGKWVGVQIVKTNFSVFGIGYASTCIYQV